MKLKTITILLITTALISCSFKNSKNEEQNFNFNKLTQNLNSNNIQLFEVDDQSAVLGAVLKKCLNIDYTKFLGLEKNYLLQKSNVEIANITTFQIKDPAIIPPIQHMTNALFTLPRTNFGDACWEDQYTKPIFSKRVGTTLIVVFSYENFEFPSASASIQTAIIDKPNRYALDDLIQMINSMSD
ncbi:hypothetical protein EC844_101182 [Acinetobacter calcoaceticus]|uniref:Lipoprotein n=1 Tax=Acinetobacter calcoaceticus TaxID=471 RepID=A0A4V6NJG3_ACICA|nr:hypothetical protein EC844_101182 [Acinetobacter calcoaceticus]